MSVSTPTKSAVLPTPSAFEISEFLLCARFGDPTDLDDIKAFVAKYGKSWLADAKDDRGNTCLHMAGGNGHAGKLFELAQVQMDCRRVLSGLILVCYGETTQIGLKGEDGLGTYAYH